MGKPDFEAEARKIVTSDLPLDAYVASFAAALADAYERGRREGYVQGFDDGIEEPPGDVQDE